MPLSSGNDSDTSLWIHVEGANFIEVISVRLGGVDVLDLTVTGSTVLDFRVPAHAPGTSRVADLRVETIRGVTTKRAAHLYYPDPFFHVTDVTPRSGPRDGGTTITVTGQLLFDVTSVSFVYAWGDEAPLADLENVSDGMLTATAPPGHPSAGPMMLRLRKDDGSIADFPSAWHWELSDITVTGIEPARSNAGGAAITLTGTRFTESVDVQVGGTSVAYDIVDDETITLTTPTAADLGIEGGEVTVQVVGGEDPALARATFTYDALRVASLNPNESPISGGPTIEVHGVALDGVVDLKVDNVSVGFVIVSPELLTFEAPAGSSNGPVEIELESSYGEDVYGPPLIYG